MRICINGETFDRDFYMIAFGNGTMYGGGMKVLPNSVNDDGEFDICLVESVNFFQVLRHLPKFIDGKHGIFKDLVHFFRAKEITIHTPEPMDAQADGEIIPSITDTYARVLPKAILVRVPAGQTEA